MKRDKLEQEAMKQLQRGNTEKALERYLEILRSDAKDRRIRQKVAELYLALGRKSEAGRHLTDVARSLKSAGQDRAAASVYKQLIALRPEDTDAHVELAQCLETVGRRQDAVRVWEQAFALTQRRDPKKAIDFARSVARLSPGEVPLQVRVAELLEAGRESELAFEAWTKLGAEARRFGRADDQARFLERALQLRPDDMDTLLQAAEARVVQGEHRVALGHLQRAYGRASSNVRLLTLLGRALQGLEQLDKARKVWLQAARRHAEAGDRDGRVDALRHVIECGETDVAVRNELDRADEEARRHRLRLDERDWAGPVTDDEIRVIARADTLRRYGFLSRARTELEAAGAAVKSTVPWQVHFGELLLRLGESDAGVAMLRSVRAPTAAAELELRSRLEILGTASVAPAAPAAPAAQAGPAASLSEESQPPPSDSSAQISTPSLVTPAPETDEQVGDRLVGLGDRDGALAAYRRAMSERPGDTDLLMKIGEFMTSGPGGLRSAEAYNDQHRVPPSGTMDDVVEQELPLDLPEPGPQGVDFSAGFGDVDPDQVDQVVDTIAEARAMVTVGRYEEALDLLRNQDDAEALVVSALAAGGLGRQEGVQTRLERAVQVAGEHHPAYIEALWDLSAVYLLRRKAGNAERLLDELAMLDPTWRPGELAARRRGIEILRER